MKHFLVFFLAVMATACSPEAPEFGQDEQGLGALFIRTNPGFPATYKPSIKKLDGTGNAGIGWTMPVKHLTLILKNSSGIVLDTIVDLPPTLIYDMTSVTQTVTTSYTTQVTKVSAQAIDANGVLVGLNLDVI